MQSAQVREAFLEFFTSKGHTPVASSGLIPDNDPTLLFTNAGMVPFKDVFLGNDKRSYSTATSCQKCLRISGKHNDLENVGVTARHLTFFEMLGNFSFGDYFKKEAIEYGWEFVTEVLKLPKEKLWVTVLHNDDEAAELWAKHTDVRPERILRMTEKDNFWAMGETGPCGPSSEIFYYTGADLQNQSEEEFRKDDGTYVEIWNLVFMQFDRAGDGTLSPLPSPCVDTGSGLERVASACQDVKATYDTDVLRSIISVAEQLSGFKYDGSSYEERDLKTDKAYARDVAMRVIADHTRAVAFLIADGVYPDSEGRGYVLRRLIRRAVRHGRVLDFKKPFFKHTTKCVIELMGGHYPELEEKRELIIKVADAEEQKFHETLEAGLNLLEKELKNLKPGQAFPGESAFLLHDTYGFPLDLTQDALKAHGVVVDTAGFEKAMAAQRERSREDRKSQSIAFESIKVEADRTEFLGYSCTEADSKLLQIVELEAPGEVGIITAATPFYAESGGQVGDRGTIKVKDIALEVLDTQKLQDKYFVHYCRPIEGVLSDQLIGEQAHMIVDGERRSRIRSNHSATHLIHSALRNVLGTHVKQAGSRVDQDTTRFDYSHFEQVSTEQLAQIQDFVNQQIRANHEVVIQEMPIDEARKRGAMALFGEKYGDVVRVVEIGPQSLELCGGTHVARSGDIGLCIIQSESGISAGARRIECWSGAAAYDELVSERRERAEIAALLKGDASELSTKVERLLARNRELEKLLDKAKGQLASAASGDLVGSARLSPKGIKVIAQCVDGADSDTLRSMVDRLRVKLGSGVVALGSSQAGKGLIVAGVTSDLTKQVNAGQLVKEAASVSGGRGGGRADFAQAGGVDPAKLDVALDKLFEMVS